MKRADETTGLRDRLLRFLSREEQDEHRSSSELRSLPVDQRVLEGECIEGAVLRRVDSDAWVFDVKENLSKFRSGDAIAVGDGLDFEDAAPLLYGGYDADRHQLVLEPDRFSRCAIDLELGRSYVLDRRPLGLRGRLRDVVMAGFDDARIASVLEGRHVPTQDEARVVRARRSLADSGLNQAQIDAGSAAIGTESLVVVQGPPGTGKTRLLAEALRILCGAGCRIALSAFTHRAVDNVLLALRELAPSVIACKIGNPGSGAAALRRAGVRVGANPRRGGLPEAGCVIAGTGYALARLPDKERFHYTVFDEAGQLPIPHAIAGMLLAKRWLFFGDHEQLPPVVKAVHHDGVVMQSIFQRMHELYGSHLLDTTYRMNDGVCRVVSDAFYGGRLRPDTSAATRRLPGGGEAGRFRDVLDPEVPFVIATVDHAQPGSRSIEEAEVCAALVEELRHHHDVPPQEIALIAPFRAQVRQIRSSLQRRGVDDDALVVDTVERIQGQEREVVILSLTVGDPATLEHRASFFFSTNRLNVALSRARSKAVLVASPGAFQALPGDVEALRAASKFKELWQHEPRVDVSDRWASR